MSRRAWLPVICISLAVPFASLGEGEEAGASRTVTTTVDRDVVPNEDGSKTIEKSVTHTNAETGATWGHETSTIVRPAEDGKAWSSTTTRTGPNGGTLETEASGSVTRNEDGSRTIARESTTTNPKTGESVTHAVERTATKTEDGASWTTNRTTDTSRGGHAESTTTGAMTRNGDGSGNVESHTTGSSTGAAGRERSWETDRSGEWSRSDQGGRDFETSRETTTGSGRTWGVDRQGSAVRNDDGSQTRSVTTSRSGDVPRRDRARAGGTRRRR